MDKINALLDQLDKIPGAEGVAKKLRAECTSLQAEVTEATDDAAAARKEAKTSKKAADDLKRDLDAGAGSKDEVVKKAENQRDEWKRKAEAAEAKVAVVAKRAALARELGIKDPVRSEHAVDALMARLPDDVTLDDSGRKLVGVTKHVNAFRKDASFYFRDEAEGDEEPEDGEGEDADEKAKSEKIDRGSGGPRNGQDAPTLRKGGPGRKKEESREEKIERYGNEWDARNGHAPKAAGAASK